ncbi:MAG: endonuclease/exonuclease/phosphatase family protein [Pseudomonadota bacterium]
MRILMLNAWDGRLHDDLLPYLAAAQADVLCLQEVIHTAGAGQDWLTYRDDGMALPQRARFFTDLCAALPDHQGIFCPAARGDLFHGETAIPSQWGLATFIHRRHMLIGQLQDLVFRDFSADGYGDHPRSRSAHVVRIFDEAADRPITIAHMHGLRDPEAGKADTAQRKTQADRFLRMIRSIHRPGERLIVGGDFNVPPGSETLTMLGTLGLTDLVTTRGFEGTRTRHYGKPGRFADYLMVNGDVPVRAFDVVTEPAVSDHCALMLDTG